MNLEEAKKEVFPKKPEFAKLYKKYGKKNWQDYIEEKFPKRSFLNEKKEELFEAIKEITLPVIGKEKTEKIIRSLDKTGFVSSADHNGLLSHPFFSHFALLRAKKDQALISFVCGSISLSNSSYPRGFYFHDESLSEIKLPFVSLKGRRRSIYGHEGFKRDQILKIKNHKSKINTEAEKRLNNFLEKILKTEKLFSFKLLSDQFLFLNDLLWEEIFGEELGNLAYLETETIVRNLLLKNHIGKGTIFDKMIFNKEIRESFIKNYEKVTCAHDTENKKGSHLFWLIDKNTNSRRQMFVVNNRLETTDENISIELNSETISKHLENFELLPTTAFCYSMISFYYGVTLGGGFSQIQYLGDMKKAYEKVLTEFELETNELPPTDIFSGEVTVFGLSNKKETVPATLLDFLIYKDENTLERVEETNSEVSVEKSIDGMMEEFVEIANGIKPKITDLPKISSTLIV